MTNRFYLRPGRAAIVAVLLIFLSGKLPADDFEGAGGLLKKLYDLATAPGKASPAASKDGAVQFKSDLDAFTKQSPGMAPEAAARGWLALFDRSLKLLSSSGQGIDGSATRATFSALPGPASWPSLRELVAARDPDKEANPIAWRSLRMIVDTLGNSEDQQWAELSGMASTPNANTAMARTFFQSGDAFVTFGAALSEVATQPGKVEKFWDTALTRLNDPNAPTADPRNSELELPDLVTLLGPEKAGPLILRALLLPDAQISKIKGQATEDLARKLALENVDKITSPPWYLTESLQGAPLFEALRKKFPNDTDSQGYAIYYVLALVTQGRFDEAAKADTGIDLTELEEATVQAANAGWSSQVYEFFHTYLGQYPESDLWKFYIDLAGRTGHSADALKFLQDTNARSDLSEDARDQVRAVLYRGLLAVDRVDDGIEQLRALIKSKKSELASGPKTSASDSTSMMSILSHGSRRVSMIRRYVRKESPVEKLVQWDLELARIGHLLKRDALENEGLDDAVAQVRNMPQPSPDSDLSISASVVSRSVSTYEIETGRYGQAEKLIIDEIVDDQRRANAQSANRRGLFDYGLREHMYELALVYYEAGRWADIVALLEKNPAWGANDLVEIAKGEAYLPRRSTPHLDLMAARALAESGRIDEARPILYYALQDDPGNDAAYALLLKIGQGDLVAKLDALYREDQFQERPLIWKAVVLLQQGKVADAENACKAAIAVDPSDGEEGKGDRMRVYSVMADVCDAKKDPQQATFFRNVIKAIRLSEDADDYYDAGLLTHAVTMYDQALDLFSGAYCIQSRIARQLADLGRMAEAAVHYRKAFELMPVSFGRLESHCFGCERAFQGETATSIAEKTFTEMMAKDPTKPQIPYLLGYLYLEEKRYADALPQFEKAAALDPDYINAWRHISEIGEQYRLDPKEQDAAVFNLMRLDPAGRHVTVSTEYVRDLGKLWQVRGDANKGVPPEPTTLFPLTASAAALKASGTPSLGSNLMQLYNLPGANPEMQAWMDLQQIGFRLGRGVYYARGEKVSPLDAVLGNQVISRALDFL